MSRFSKANAAALNFTGVSGAASATPPMVNFHRMRIGEVLHQLFLNGGHLLLLLGSNTLHSG